MKTEPSLNERRLIARFQEEGKDLDLFIAGLREKGKTWEEVAAAIGISLATLMRYKRRWTKEESEKQAEIAA